MAAGVFFAYFVAYEPYRALYPDLLEAERVAGRSQSTQAIWRGAGTGLALLAGGLLLSGGRVARFAPAAAVVAGTAGAFAWFAVRRGFPGEERWHVATGVREHLVRFRGQWRARPRLRAYLVANALRVMALAAVKAYVVLYLSQGLGYSLVTASLIVGGTGVIVLAGTAAAGKLGDRPGRARVMRWALWIYGLGFAVSLLFTSKPVIAASVPAIALAGGAVMALADPLLMPQMPEDERGILTGVYSVSRAVGITIGPVLAGILISLTANGVFEQTRGFPGHLDRSRRLDTAAAGAGGACGLHARVASCMAKNVQVRNVPERVHRELKARAAADGSSLSDYLLRELERIAERPRVADVLLRARGRHGGASTREIVRATREARERR